MSLFFFILPRRHPPSARGKSFQRPGGKNGRSPGWRGKTSDDRKYQRNKSEPPLQIHSSASSCSSHSEHTSYSARSDIEMTSYVGELKILWLLLTLTVLLDGSPATRKISRAPVNFRYTKDLNAEATGHGGTYYKCYIIKI